MVGPKSGLCSSKREDAPSLLGAVDLGERLTVAAKVPKDAGAQPASEEGIGVVWAKLGALFLERKGPGRSSVPSISASASP